MPDLKLSDDGLYYWDGRQWVSTLSHDGRQRWNGTAWVAVSGVAPPAFAAPPRQARVPTPWTLPLQYAVAGYYLIQGIWAVATPFFLKDPILAYTNQILERNQQLNPDAQPPPADFMTTMATFISVGLVIGAVIGVAITALVIIGTMKRWTWMFYVVLVLLGLGALSLPFSIVTALVSVPLASNPVAVSPLLTWSQIVIGIPGAAIFIWMLVAIVRYGPWAMARPPEGTSSVPA